MPIDVKLDLMMTKNRISSTELASRLGITMANLSILKNNKARAIRLTTLDKLCKILNCTPGDLIVYYEGQQTNGESNLQNEG
jgi:putative transcriptional regulator